MDPVQIVIIFISLTITVLVVVLGVQVMYILQEFRKSLEKVNSMLDDGKRVSTAMSDTVESASGLISGIGAGLSFLSNFRKRRNKNE